MVQAISTTHQTKLYKQPHCSEISCTCGCGVGLFSCNHVVVSPLTQLTALSFTTQEPAVHVAVRSAGWPVALAGLNRMFLSLHWAMQTCIATARDADSGSKPQQKQARGQEPWAAAVHGWWLLSIVGGDISAAGSVSFICTEATCTLIWFCVSDVSQARVKVVSHPVLLIFTIHCASCSAIATVAGNSATATVAGNIPTHLTICIVNAVRRPCSIQHSWRPPHTACSQKKFRGQQQRQ